MVVREVPVESDEELAELVEVEAVSVGVSLGVVSLGVVSLGVVVINWVSEEEVEVLVILLIEVLEGVEESNVDDGVLTDPLSSTIRNQ